MSYRVVGKCGRLPDGVESAGMCHPCMCTMELKGIVGSGIVHHDTKISLLFLLSSLYASHSLFLNNKVFVLDLMELHKAPVSPHCTHEVFDMDMESLQEIGPFPLFLISITRCLLHQLIH